jgi:hypothetical protein
LLAPPDGAAPVLLIFNPEPAPVLFVLPGGAWLRALDSTSADVSPTPVIVAAVDVPPHGFLLLTGAGEAR